MPFPNDAQTCVSERFPKLALSLDYNYLADRVNVNRQPLVSLNPWKFTIYKSRPKKLRGMLSNREYFAYQDSSPSHLIFLEKTFSFLPPFIGMPDRICSPLLARFSRERHWLVLRVIVCD